jgi:hypothetical protein
MKSRRFWIVLFSLILSTVLLFQYRLPIAKGLGGFLAKKDSLEKCEVIFAPWSRLRSNFVYAMGLVKEGWGERLIMTTPKAAPAQQGFREAYGLESCSAGELLRKVAEKENLPVEKFTILEDSISSYTDCELLHAYWKGNPFQSVMVVTDAPHARRFRMAMNKVFREAPVKIISCPSFPDRPLEDFFADKEDYVMYVASEYVKIVAYVLKYSFRD